MARIPLWVWFLVPLLFLGGGALVYINRKGILASEPRTVSVKGIVVHHTGTAKQTVTEQVLASKELSTHFEVTQDGKVYQYLDPAKQVAWATGAGANKHTIGIDVTHVSGAPWPKVQVEATRKLIHKLARDFNLPVVVAPDGIRKDWIDWEGSKYTVFRHRNFKATACPEDFPLEAMV